MIGGTKRPSITSTWMTRAPASITSSICAPSRAKSAERIDGATRRSAISSAIRSLIAAFLRSHVPEHRAAAVLAGHVLGGAHPGDRLVFATVRALRDELEAAQTVDAAEAAGELRGAQPGLAAARARRPPEDALAVAGLAHVQPSSRFRRR